MHRLLPLLPLLLGLGCAGRPQPAAPSTSETPIEAPARAETQAASQAAVVAPKRQGPLAHLRALPPKLLPAAIDALKPAAAARAYAAAEANEPAQAWLALALARMAAHRGDEAEARTLLLAAEAAQPSTAARARITETRAQLLSAAPTRPRRLGLLLPLSGPFGAIGTVAKVGAELAIANRKGVQWVVADTRGDATEARRQVERLVRDEGVVGILGPVGQIEGRAAAETAQRLGVPIMSLSTAPGLTTLGDNVFRHRLLRTTQATAVAQYACKQLGIKRFAILYPRSDYGHAMMRAFWHAVEACGGEIRGAQGYGLHDHDFAEPIKKLIGRADLRVRRKSRHWKDLNRKSKDPAQHVAPIVDFEGLFIPDSGARAGLILPFLKYWDVELKTGPWMDGSDLTRKYEGHTPSMVQILGAGGFNSPAFLRRGGVLTHNAVFVDAFWYESNDMARDFTEQYQTRTDKMPSALAAHAHDAALILTRAAAGGGDRAAVRHALNQTARHHGVFGITRVQPGGEVSFWPSVLTVQAGIGVTLRADELGYEDEDAP
jgi:ABC-type branched-subunit amino acid transport system substrate-binding protein